MFRQACYYVSESKVNAYDAAAQCGLLAPGAHLAVAMTVDELEKLRVTTPMQQIWLGNHS